MAGIGFELRKIIGKGGLGSFLKVALSGTMIVAGPWLMSILGITLMQLFMGFALVEAPKLFMGIVVYSYAFSLFLFGGFHYIFTRIIADDIYEKRENDAATALLFFTLLFLIISIIIAVIFLSKLELDGISFPRLFKFSAGLLFSTLNAVWLIMIFISLLKWYIRILTIYLAGMAFSLLYVYLLGQRFSLAGAMLGFALGHVLIVVLLFVLAFHAYKPGALFKHLGKYWHYFKRFRLLFGTGLFYYWAMWIDKMVHWFVLGRGINGTFVRLFESYDVIVYFANLTMIPGLVYFVIISETNFYVLLRKFLVSMGISRYAIIQRQKYQLIRGMWANLREQSMFQGMITFSLIILAPNFIRFVVSDPGGAETLQITLLAVFFHLLTMTLLNFLFYLELYSYSFFTCLVFFLVNFIGSIATSVIWGGSLAGVSYLAAGIVASLFAALLLSSAVRRVDRRILSGSTT